MLYQRAVAIQASAVYPLGLLGSLPSPGKGGASHLNSVSGVHPDNVKPSKINPNNILSGNDHNINPNNVHPNNINPNNAQSAAHCTGFGVGANPCNKHVDPCLINPCPINPCVLSPCPTPDGKVVVGTKSTVNSYSSSLIIVSEEQGIPRLQIMQTIIKNRNQVLKVSLLLMLVLTKRYIL